ncbi:MAG: glycoside hydrolase family 2 protein [Lachnospiraceae bacterium]|nr:glycoside hydrolase family 2 protein [Lachnospiraceae bacterium]
MEKQFIGGFKLKRLSNGAVYEAGATGSVLEILVREKVIPDPFVDDNEKYALKVMEEDFEFITTFDADENIFISQKKELVFEGIDTVADVYLNNTLILKACNMHRTFRADVTGILKIRENELAIRLHSPIRFIRDAYKKCECDGSEEAMQGFVHIRKAHYMFGWDWGIRLPDAGIFRPVYLEGNDLLRIAGFRIHQEHYEGHVGLTVFVNEEPISQGLSTDIEKPEYHLTVKDPENRIIFDKAYEPESEIRINDPLLWWPRGYGRQNLYEVTLKVSVNGRAIMEASKKIGLRTMTLNRKKDEYGESFAHCVNGTDVFAFGADYVPEDNFLGRINKERTENLLEQCVAANFNTIRVWGGGFFPGDEFYDACDRLGLLVWQDMMFACGIYDLNPEFEENIRLEIKDNLERLADHPCMALLCGNNEMEMFVNGNLWVKRHRQKADYIKMYEYLFPKWTAEYAPDLVYWPSSPSSGGSFDDPNDFSRGDVHFWDVWHNNKPFTEYRRHNFRYLSEFGFQALPSMETLKHAVSSKEDMNLFSFCMEKHQRNRSANSKIMNYMQATFKYPTDFDTLIYASQLLSGEAIRYGVEHFRRNRGICMGTLYWQLNDCWPVISWSSIDYYGRWKALHYFAKRFFAPVLLSCEETSTVSNEIDINAEVTDFVPAIRLNVSNETMESKIITVCYEVRNSDGTLAESFGQGVINHVHVEPLSSFYLPRTELKGLDIYSQYVSFRAFENEKEISGGTALFTAPKYFKFKDPGLAVSAVSQNEIMVTSMGFAKNVEIRNENDDLILEDNFFDMDPGVRTLKVTKGSLTGLRIRSVFDIH